MTAANYTFCEDRVLEWEGGYTNDAADPGGPTNWGITIYDARMYWLPNATAADVRAMPKSVAHEIYRAKYWNAMNCDAVPSGLDYTIFDYGVNSGIGRSGKVLRRVLGLADTDWHVTPDVLAAVAAADVARLVAGVNDERIGFLQRLKTWPTFGKGWSTRVAGVRKVSLQLVGHPAALGEGGAKAIDADVPQGTKWIQVSLNKIGMKPPLDEDGHYGLKTREAVYLYQQSRNLIADGLCGEQTCAAIDADLAKLPKPTR